MSSVQDAQKHRRRRTVNRDPMQSPGKMGKFDMVGPGGAPMPGMPGNPQAMTSPHVPPGHGPVPVPQAGIAMPQSSQSMGTMATFNPQLLSMQPIFAGQTPSMGVQQTGKICLSSSFTPVLHVLGRKSPENLCHTFYRSLPGTCGQCSSQCEYYIFCSELSKITHPASIIDDCVRDCTSDTSAVLRPSSLDTLINCCSSSVCFDLAAYWDPAHSYLQPTMSFLPSGAAATIDTTMGQMIPAYTHGWNTMATNYGNKSSK